MGIILGSTEKVSGKDYNETAEKITAYEEHYMKLLREYDPEIRNLESMMESLRRERIEFYNKIFPEIQRTIRNDEVMSDNAKEQWINELRDNMEMSLKISESLISHYVTSNLTEFKEKMKKAFNRV